MKAYLENLAIKKSFSLYDVTDIDNKKNGTIVGGVFQYIGKGEPIAFSYKNYYESTSNSGYWEEKTTVLEKEGDTVFLTIMDLYNILVKYSHPTEDHFTDLSISNLRLIDSYGESSDDPLLLNELLCQIKIDNYNSISHEACGMKWKNEDKTYTYFTFPGNRIIIGADNKIAYSFPLQLI